MGHPFYMQADSNFVVTVSLRGNFSLSLFNAALTKDSAGMLEKQVPDTCADDMIRFIRNDGPKEMEDVILANLKEANNSVNNLHFEWKDCFRKLWRGPVTKSLDGYARWMAARRDTDPVRVFRSIIASSGER
ncbi:MAG: hypothetical protein ACEPO2_22255 [Pelagibaca sp.]